MDDGEGSNVLGAPAEAGGMPRVRSGISIRITPDTALETERRGAGGSGGGGQAPLPPLPPPREAQTYQVSFSKHLPRLQCLVAGYLGGASSQTNLRIHFTHRHM